MKEFLEKIQLLNRRHLKIIAIITMFIDHLSVFLWNNIGMNYELYYFLRCIGRIAFPLYAFMFVEGLIKTRNKKKHLLMLIVMSIITEPFFDKALMGSWYDMGHQNVLFLFLLCGIVLYLVELLPKERGLAAFILLFPTAYIAEMLNLDYGAYGVIPIFVFYLLKKYQLASALSIFLTFFFEANMMGFVYIPVPILILYNNEEPKLGKIEKKFYQYFYPIHLGLITGIGLLFFR